MAAFDWQVVVVTLVALGALGVIVRRIVPFTRQGPRREAGCEHCASSPQARQASAAAPRTTTTPVVPLEDLRASARRR